MSFAQATYNQDTVSNHFVLPILKLGYQAHFSLPPEVVDTEHN